MINSIGTRLSLRKRKNENEHTEKKQNKSKIAQRRGAAQKSHEKTSLISFLTEQSTTEHSIGTAQKCIYICIC